MTCLAIEMRKESPRNKQEASGGGSREAQINGSGWGMGSTRQRYGSDTGAEGADGG